MKINKRALKNPKVINGLLVLIIIVLIAAIIVGVKQGTLFQSNTEVSEAQVQRVIKKLDRLIVLPAEETPVVARITNAEALKTAQSFYENASDGDYVLVYPEAGQAFIFNSRANKVVNVGPVIGQPAAPASSENETTEAVEEAAAVPDVDVVAIEIRNGSTIPGLATDLEAVMEEFAEYDVVAVENAFTDTYTGNIVVDLTDTGSLVTEQLAQELNAEVLSVLPEGESPSDAELVIILGEGAE